MKTAEQYLKEKMIDVDDVYEIDQVNNIHDQKIHWIDIEGLLEDYAQYVTEQLEKDFEELKIELLRKEEKIEVLEDELKATLLKELSKGAITLYPEIEDRAPHYLNRNGNIYKVIETQ